LLTEITHKSDHNIDLGCTAVQLYHLWSVKHYKRVTIVGIYSDCGYSIQIAGVNNLHAFKQVE